MEVQPQRSIGYEPPQRRRGTRKHMQRGKGRERTEGGRSGRRGKRGNGRVNGGGLRERENGGQGGTQGGQGGTQGGQGAYCSCTCVITVKRTSCHSHVFPHLKTLISPTPSTALRPTNLIHFLRHTCTSYHLIGPPSHTSRRLRSSHGAPLHNDRHAEARIREKEVEGKGRRGCGTERHRKQHNQ